jgi:hypothetical protein
MLHELAHVLSFASLPANTNDYHGLWWQAICLSLGGSIDTYRIPGTNQHTASFIKRSKFREFAKDACDMLICYPAARLPELAQNIYRRFK